MLFPHLLNLLREWNAFRALRSSLNGPTRCSMASMVGMASASGEGSSGAA